MATIARRRRWMPHYEQLAFSEDLNYYLRTCSFFNNDILVKVWEYRKSILKTIIIDFFFNPTTPTTPPPPTIPWLIVKTPITGDIVDDVQYMLAISFRDSIFICEGMTKYRQSAEDFVSLHSEQTSEEAFKSALGVYMSNWALLEPKLPSFRKLISESIADNIYMWFYQTGDRTEHGLAEAISNFINSKYNVVFEASLFLEMADQLLDIFDVYADRNSLII